MQDEAKKDQKQEDESIDAVVAHLHQAALKQEAGGNEVLARHLRRLLGDYIARSSAESCGGILAQHGTHTAANKSRNRSRTCKESRQRRAS